MTAYCVVTTINHPTKTIEVLYEKFGENLIIVADKKTPIDWNYKDVFPISHTKKEYAPYNHYARKNLGYMEAIRAKASVIYDVDDDNIPNDKWIERGYFTGAYEAIEKNWVNVYKIFSDEHIWPRGFSLKHINDTASCGFNHSRFSSIQQGLADGEPDVDAIWRLVFDSKKHNFTKNKSVYLSHGSWCPFNSQSTWWFPKAYVLMYLPISATFRMCDIWRSFIAQRCIWEIGEGVTFHSPSEVYQDRNEHDLIDDFCDEYYGYKNNDAIIQILNKTQLKKGQEYIIENMLTCYNVLLDERVLAPQELISVKSWINDYTIATGNMG